MGSACSSTKNIAELKSSDEPMNPDEVKKFDKVDKEKEHMEKTVLEDVTDDVQHSQPAPVTIQDNSAEETKQSSQRVYEEEKPIFSHPTHSHRKHEDLSQAIPSGEDLFGEDNAEEQSKGEPEQGEGSIGQDTENDPVQDGKDLLERCDDQAGEEQTDCNTSHLVENTGEEASSNGEEEQEAEEEQAENLESSECEEPPMSTDLDIQQEEMNVDQDDDQ